LRAQEAAAALDAHLEAFDSRIAVKAEEGGQALEKLVSRLDLGLDARVQMLRQTLTGRALDIARALCEGGGDVIRALDEKAQEIGTAMTARAAAIAETLDGG